MTTRQKKSWLFILLLIPLALLEAGWTSPINGTVTSSFGWRTHPIYGTQIFHSGVDIGADYGMPVGAAEAGQVAYAGWISGYGNTVILRHDGGLTTLYGHNQALAVTAGQTVSEGQVIAYAGSTGNSTGPHVHFEVRLNDQPVDPGAYVPNLGFGANVNGAPLSDEGKYKDWELVNDFAKPIKEILDSITELFTKGLKLLQNYVASLFFILCLIDLALGAMGKVTSPVEEDKEGLVPWIIRRCFFYGFCLVFLYNWSDFVGNLSLRGFPVIGGMAAGDPAAAQAAVSDPTQIVQKGMSIVAPIVNATLRTRGDVFDVLFSQPAVLFCLLIALALFALFCIIGYFIALAYIQFYASVLFSFTSFPLAGLRHVRHFAANGMNGVLACSINLMFFCFFAAALQTTMASFVPPQVIQQVAAVQSSLSGGSAVDRQLNDLGKQQIQEIYNQLLSLGYTPEAAAGICGNIAQESQGDATSGMEKPNGPSGIAQWMGSRRDKLVNDSYGLGGDVWTIAYQVRFLDQEMIEYGLKDKLNSAGSAAAASDIVYDEFERPGDGSDGKRAEIASELAGQGGIAGQVSALANVGILLQILLLTLLFMYMGDRVSRLIMEQFGGQGFRLYNEQGVFGR